MPNPLTYAQGWDAATAFILEYEKRGYGTPSPEECADERDRSIAAAPQTGSGEPEVSEELLARLVKADIAAPYCQPCADADIYERSPESCPKCAEQRIVAVLGALRAASPASSELSGNSGSLPSGASSGRTEGGQPHG